jgi:hypothetical protein
MLIFSTPYLFMLLFSYHKKIVTKHIAFVILGLMIINIFTLIYGRDYYKIFYKQPYEQTARKAIIDKRANDVFLIGGYIPYYTEYYFNKYGSAVPFIPNEDINSDLLNFATTISQIKENNIVVEGLTGEQVQVVQSYFPYQTGFDYGFTYEIYTFSKNKPTDQNIIERDIIAQTNFADEVGVWKNIQDMIDYDICSDETYCTMTSLNEWGPSVSFDLMDIAPKGLGIIDVELEMAMTDTISKCVIVSTISEGKDVISWNALNFEDYHPVKGEWKKVFFTIDIQHVLKSRKNMEGLVLKINIWNVSKTDLLINYINIYRKPGNPVRYGLFNEIYR